MNSVNDIEIAIDILAIKFSKSMFNKDILRQLMKERELVYSGDKKTIEKVINEYGKEIKEDIIDGR